MIDAGIRAHQEWLGLIQPVGLVVAPSALVAAQVELDRGLKDRWFEYDTLLIRQNDVHILPDFVTFAREFLGWTPEQLVGTAGGTSLPSELIVALPELGEQLEPSFAVSDPHRDGQWLLLIRIEHANALDRVSDTNAGGWGATPHERFERLLRETGVAAGLLVTGDTIRFVYAPRGESSGYMSFPVAAMATVHGRPMLSALYELMKHWRLSRACPEERGLRRILENSRKYQNEVSTRLAEQVLGALYELTRGFQAADVAASGAVLQETLRLAPLDVYGGLITMIMRLVFVLFAEERAMLPKGEVWDQHYGVGSLFAQLRDAKARYPDTMDQRYGAWSRLLSLFRILHDGATHDDMTIPAREGELFDPDRYPFLEGRPYGTCRVVGERLARIPQVSDGTLLRVLEQLLMLDEERLSYRTLDVEQIGSVYESMMGFEVRAASGRSIAVKPKTKKAGSATHPLVDLDALLAMRGADRAKWLKDECDCEVSGKDASDLLRAASDTEGLLEALRKRISPFTPQPVDRGGLVLVPTEERRRSGSHYTPRELTEPIVATTLRPVLEGLGPSPTSAQLLSLRVCDPAMGSGAFLVGACRWLGDKVVEAWQRAGSMPIIPLDEEPQLYARRLVAQQCLFGVDRNPFAVQLAKLSLWLVTLAREHPFTFLDHALRCGDSLVGLTRRQLEAFHWDPTKPATLFAPRIEDRVRAAVTQRQAIEGLAESDDTREKVRLLREADDELRAVRLIGDSVLAAFFGAEKPRARETARQQREQEVVGWLGDPTRLGRVEEATDVLRRSEQRVVPFHWEVEFPEVFLRDNPGFDAIVGNPPFAGKNTLIAANPEHYLDWLKTIHAGAHGNADLVAHFFRRTFTLLRQKGTFGLIATNTIAQGDTRATGLRWLRQHGCTLYDARRRYKWPGVAAVVVSVVHGARGVLPGPYQLDGREVPRITAFLFHDGGDNDPASLVENTDKSFQGSIVLGMGLTFDDDNEEATSLAEMRRLILTNPRNNEVIFPYIGGEEVNDSPTHAHRRYVINFGQMGEGEARAGWPDLMRIVEQRVRPQRLEQKDDYGREYWWRFLRTRPELHAATAGFSRVLAISRVGQFGSWTYLATNQVFAESLVIVAQEGAAMFAALQSRPHELWARFFGSSMKDDLRYTPSDCFETFPFPDNWQKNANLERAGCNYYDFRAQLMIANQEGLTATYNRFHDPDEHDPGIIRLRDLHVEMDRAVLDAYGWADLRPNCVFRLDYDEEEEGGTSGRRRKPWRYRWLDAVRDEILARLLALNSRRAGGATPVDTLGGGSDT